MKKRTWAIAALVVAIALVSYVVFRPRSDVELTEALVGRWVAQDPANPTLHTREDGVAREEIDIRTDGTLTYLLDLKTSATAPSTATAEKKQTLWGWKVHKGRLLLKDMGSGSTQEWMPPLKFSVSRNSISIDRRKYATKQFTRLANG